MQVSKFLEKLRIESSIFPMSPNNYIKKKLARGHKKSAGLLEAKKCYINNVISVME